MKQLLAVLLLLLTVACTEKVEVTICAPSDWELYGVDTIRVTCHPARNVSYVELLIDSAVAGVDTFPDPTYYTYQWDVRQLPEGGVHRLQARATSGSHEYLSSEKLAAVGFRSRIIVDGPDKTFSVYLPNGELDTTLVPLEHVLPAFPRFRSGCGSVVFIADHELYEVALPYGQAQLLATVGNGIYSCDASPASDLVAFEAYPAGTAHLFIQDSSGHRVQLTHDSDFVLIDSSRFTCVANSIPVFSPDGTRLAYCRKSRCLVPGDPHEGEYRQDAFVMNRDGSNPVNLTAGVDDLYFSGFTWTFDGKWVLFRVGTAQTPDGVLAANMAGRTVTALAVLPVAMACSPTDSTLIYVGTDLEQRLYSVRLVWTDDTLYVGRPGILLGGDAYAQRRYIDWASYSPQQEKRVTNSPVSRQCFDRAGL